ELVADSFSYDAASHRLYVKSSNAIAADQMLEVSVRRQVLQAENAVGLTISGLDFAHANTSLSARWGAVKVSGRNNLLDDLVVSDMDAVCVQISGTDSALTNSVIQRCGQSGVSGSGTRLTIAGNRITYANTRGFNKWWEAGGIKLIGEAGLHDSVIRENLVAYCQADGIWVDWKNTGNLIEGNTTAYNSGFGIQYEASQSGTIRGNVSYGNGLRGIYLLESANSVVEGNAVFANSLEGIGIVDGSRSASDPTLRPVNNRVTGNSIAWNDFNRNWVQLVLPGPGYGNFSDGNSFKSEGILPRASLGFVAPGNPAYVSIASWRATLQLDTNSVEQAASMPAALQSAIATRRLIGGVELPGFLSRPGTY
ncbi:MAG: right-handed parallel beta-helix repeat-containing protein, partial [Pseudomonadota bacterium]|nr:right-handed parallel beta-helix repeat-containing protein [Pseudomonadota bacterium]